MNPENSIRVYSRVSRAKIPIPLPLFLICVFAVLCLAANVAFLDIRLNLTTGIADVATNGKYGQLRAGTIVMQSLPGSSTPTITAQGATGAATWTYKIVAKQVDGSAQAAGGPGSDTNGNATLTSSNYNHITWSAVTGAASYDVYRTAHGTSPNTNGKIATVTTNSYDDKGAAGNGASAPTIDQTESIRGDGAGELKILDDQIPPIPVLNASSRRFMFSDNTVAIFFDDPGNLTIGGNIVTLPHTSVERILDLGDQNIAIDVDSRALFGLDGATILFNWADENSVTINNRASAPTGPAEGDHYYNTTTHHAFIWNGAAWKQMDN